MSTEAMKQALKALKGFQQGCAYDKLLQAGEGAIKALEEALAQQGGTATEYCVNCETHVIGPCNSVMCPIYSVETAMSLDGNALENLRRVSIRAPT